MTEIAVFLPRSQKAARRNMDDFIAYCRRLPTFGCDLDWSASAWDVSEYFQIRGTGGRTIALHFTEFGPRPAIAGVAFEGPFNDQVKAYIRYNASIKLKLYPPHRDIQAFRALYISLGEQGSLDLCALNTHVLDRAAQVLLRRLAETSAMQAAERLQRISQFLAEMRLAAAAPRDWKHGMRVTASLFNRVGPEFEARRQSKLPTQELLDALAEAFNIAKRPREIIESSVYAILCAAPDRLNEVMCLAADCEAPLLWEPSEAYGLTWRGSKGQVDHIKWIPGTMVDVVKRAVKQLREQTEQGRVIARWYEKNPTRIYLPRHLEPMRTKEVLSTEDIHEIVGVVHPGYWLKRNGLVPIAGKPKGRGRNRALYGFKDLERVVVGKLPRNFPYFDKRTRLRYSEAMLVVPYGLFNERWGTWSCMIQPVRHDQIAQALVGITTTQGSSPSIFERLGIPQPARTARATTHQFRHWLDTLALKGGLSDWDVAQWSGRKDIRQNRAYDHESSEEILSKLRKALESRDRSRGLVTDFPKNDPISREEFARLEIPNAHHTEIGFCIHDFASSPCQLFMDCINCRELVCIKGDAVRTRRLRMMIEQTRSSLLKAEQAQLEEWEGAAEWIQTQTLTLARLEQLHSIMTSQEIADGAVIRLEGTGRLTAIEQAVTDRLGGRASHTLRTSIERLQTDGKPQITSSAT